MNTKFWSKIFEETAWYLRVDGMINIKIDLKESRVRGYTLPTR
jgi:hypothetical protein